MIAKNPPPYRRPGLLPRTSIRRNPGASYAPAQRALFLSVLNSTSTLYPLLPTSTMLMLVSGTPKFCAASVFSSATTCSSGVLPQSGSRRPVLSRSRACCRSVASTSRPCLGLAAAGLSHRACRHRPRPGVPALGPVGSRECHEAHAMRSAAALHELPAICGRLIRQATGAMLAGALSAAPVRRRRRG